MLRIAYVLTEEDYIENQRAHAWRRYSPGFAFLQKTLEPVFGVLMLWWGFNLYRKGTPSALVLIEVLAGFYVLLASRVLAPALYRRAFRRTRSFEGETVIELTEHHIELDCPGISAGTVQWAAIRGFLDTPKTTLLYLSAASFLAIPRRLVNEDQHRELLEMCANNAVPIGPPSSVS